jgi:Tfp pilus assembly protein PilF
VSEESERVISGPEGNGAGVDPTAVALALAGADRDTANQFLGEQIALSKKQANLVDLQVKELAHELKLRHWSLQLRHASAILKFALEVSAALVGVAFVCFIGAAVWNASHANGLVVESFAVPPRFAEAGITGAVLSDDLNSKLGTIRDLSDSRSLSRSSNVSANRDEEFRVEIPETGVSLSQAWRYLRLWLGHERRLTGNLRTLDDGRIVLTANLTGADAFTATGSSPDLDKLEQQAAEHVYQQVDPVNYGQYLLAVGRSAERLAAARRAVELAKSARDRADAYSYFASMTRQVMGDVGLAEVRARTGISIDPKVGPQYQELASSLMLLGHDEEALHIVGVLSNLKEQDQPQALQGRGFRNVTVNLTVLHAMELGDFLAGAAAADCGDCTQPALAKFRQAEFVARAHDATESRARLAEIAALSQAASVSSALGSPINAVRGDLNRIRYYQHAALGDWVAAAADARANAAELDAGNAKSGSQLVSYSYSYPLLAVAEARSGDVSRAHADAEAMPTDCYACLRAHGVIGGLERNWPIADAWFARAIKAAPSIPFAYSEWGESLLARGQPDAAIAQFTIANQKGPHFADPLEGWGEGLMAKNESHLALAKFAEAEKYAPNWGRLHLKWGEALVYAGKPDEAKAQFARAAQLDLTPSEKSELARHP